MTAINKGRLLTFGCSMTRGDALDDIWDKTNKRNLRDNNTFIKSSRTSSFFNSSQMML